MGEAIGQVLSLGVGVALSPLAIVAAVLLLSTPRGRLAGSAFLLGWIAGLTAAVAVVLLISGGANASEGGEPASWVNVLKLVLGGLLLLVALRRWRGRPRGGAEAPMPGWMQTIDRFTPARAAGLAVLLSALNPKNLLLAVGAAAAISQTGVPAGEQAIALATFVLIGAAGPGAPVVIYLTVGERSQRMLDELRAWMATNNPAIVAVLCLLIGAKLIGDGISGL